MYFLRGQASHSHPFFAYMSHVSHFRPTCVPICNRCHLTGMSSLLLSLVLSLLLSLLLSLSCSTAGEVVWRAPSSVEPSVEVEVRQKYKKKESIQRSCHKESAPRALPFPHVSHRIFPMCHTASFPCVTHHLVAPLTGFFLWRCGATAADGARYDSRVKGAARTYNRSH